MKDKNKKTLESIKAAFKVAKDKLTNVIRCKDEDSYIYTETLYNASKNLIVFVSFSNDYLSDAAELLEAAYDSHRHSVHVKYNHTEYDEYFIKIHQFVQNSVKKSIIMFHILIIKSYIFTY